jgi:hypothetical protein
MARGLSVLGQGRCAAGIGISVQDQTIGEVGAAGPEIVKRDLHDLRAVDDKALEGKQPRQGLCDPVAPGVNRRAITQANSASTTGDR